MPLISGPSYKIFITLFTGLAVGSLLGSSIFSLIPQAFGLHLQSDKSYLWKSLMIFAGVYLFYLSERLMRIYFDKKAKQNSNKQKEQQIKLSRNKSQDSLSSNETATEGGGDRNNTSRRIYDKNTEMMTEISLAKDENQECSNQVQTISSKPNEHSHNHHHHHNLNPQEILSNALQNDAEARKKLPVRRTEIAPVAWMIIIGDGLHNFIDGLSIGAAFSDSIGLGVTTSLAVIFEEFPHELGDFAVLISSGMTVKQALGFNFLSACTCYIGMIFGILLGDMTQSASFIFALAGGMFLYISLVDMMGELSAMLEDSKHSTREVSQLLIMQNIGILTGIIIIFILSLFSNG